MPTETEMNVSNVGDLTQDGGEQPYVVTALHSGSRGGAPGARRACHGVCRCIDYRGVCLCVCVRRALSACERRARGGMSAM